MVTMSQKEDKQSSNEDDDLLKVFVKSSYFPCLCPFFRQHHTYTAAIAASVAGLSHSPYDTRPSQHDNPHFSAVRGELPSVFLNGVEEQADHPDHEPNNAEPSQEGHHTRNHLDLRRTLSDASSAPSDITVWDLGESLCDACHQDASGERAEIPVALPTSTSSALMVRLWSLRCPKDSSKQLEQFFPWRSVEKLITRQEVILALRGTRSSLSDDKIEWYADQICRSHNCGGDQVSNSGYRKIFAILVRMSRTADIICFVDRGICDGLLPLEAVPIGDGQIEMRLRGEENTKLDFLRHWNDELKHDDFEELQWTMLVPYFAKRPGHYARLYELPKKVILPWLSEERQYDGGYSWVSKVEIHPHHHNFNQLKDHMVFSNFFAVKHLKAHSSDETSTVDILPPANNTVGRHQPQVVVSKATTYSEDDIKTEFEHEIDILNRLSRRPHPHLITLLAAYQLGDECCMIFPWADCDLQSMWQHEPHPGPLEKSNLKWVLDQSLGLAQGLNRIHNSKPTPTPSERKMPQRIYGRHGDIKPENILFFRDKTNPEDRGKLVITDFGLTRFHGNDTKTYLRGMKPPATPTYRPPECDITTSPISQSFDIWSFGCVLLEFVTWYLGGLALVEQFIQKRKLHNPLMHHWLTDQFFEILQDNPKYGPTGSVVARVKQEVYEVSCFVDELHSHPACSDIIHDLLDFIMEEMVIVELKTKRVAHDTSNSKVHHTRAACGNVVGKLKSLCSQLDNLPDVLTATPRSTRVTRDLISVEIEGYTVGSRYADLPVNTGNTIRATDHPELRLGHPETW
ncbi:hypothetical protein B0T21DRAFT_438346 [Apiosordaria backusii]|uniref:Protein kinase domain-containing protein n=1 Tax=Apiosordaria backusii TaxID=314023 RepID=A0AA40ED83_9PEZI|nr:hypothetical protein B0T21DRAFT_438346 [Apiosordaria backusii]